jgi:hypothetical protein
MGFQFDLHPSHSVSPQVENPGKKRDGDVTFIMQRALGGRNPVSTITV